MAATPCIPLRDRLKPRTLLRFPGFTMHDWPGWLVYTYDFEARDCYDWYRSLVDRLVYAIGKGIHLPLFRMGDGEYAFAVGRPEDRLPFWKLSWGQKYLRLRAWLAGTQGAHKSGAAAYGWETYTAEEWSAAKSRYKECLRRIARDGILALGLHDNPIYERYIPAIFDWFDANEIAVDRSNYYHVYAVYVMMHGPDRKRLLPGRRVLVATGLRQDKREGIEKGLRREGVSDVQFIPLSSSKAMFDNPDLASVRRPVDLVLVGAGVGSANILERLRPLNTVCLDVGFCLSTIADPNLRFDRPYCVPDEEFDPAKVRFDWNGNRR